MTRPTAADWSKALKLDAKILEQTQLELEAEARRAAEPPPPPATPYQHAIRIVLAHRSRGGCLCGHFDDCNHGEIYGVIDSIVEELETADAAYRAAPTERTP